MHCRRPNALPTHGEPKTLAKNTRGGFSLVELAIAISILLIGMVSVITATSQMHSLRRQNRERTLAQNAVRSMAERMQSQSYQLVETDPGNWATSVVAAFGPGSGNDAFDIQELNTPLGAANVATIQVVTDETTTDADLLVNIGMARDLNGDGDATDADVSVDAVLLPVVITAQWRGVTGTQTYRHGFYLMGY